MRRPSATHTYSSEILSHENVHFSRLKSSRRPLSSSTDKIKMNYKRYCTVHSTSNRKRVLPIPSNLNLRSGFRAIATIAKCSERLTLDRRPHPSLRLSLRCARALLRCQCFAPEPHWQESDVDNEDFDGSTYRFILDSSRN